MKGSQFVDYGLTVLRVSYAKPSCICVKNLNRCLAVAYELVDNRGNEKFALGLVDIFVEKTEEFAFLIVEVVGSKAPEIH